jgi:hypothetical protein
LIEKIADDFVQEILKDLPLEIFLIETDISAKRTSKTTS